MEFNKREWWSQGWRLVSNKEKTYGVIGFGIYLAVVAYVVWRGCHG